MSVARIRLNFEVPFEPPSLDTVFQAFKCIIGNAKPSWFDLSYEDDSFAISADLDDSMFTIDIEVKEKSLFTGVESSSLNKAGEILERIIACLDIEKITEWGFEVKINAVEKRPFIDQLLELGKWLARIVDGSIRAVNNGLINSSVAVKGSRGSAAVNLYHAFAVSEDEELQKTIDELDLVIVGDSRASVFSKALGLLAVSMWFKEPFPKLDTVEARVAVCLKSIKMVLSDAVRYPPETLKAILPRRFKEVA